MKMTNWFNKFLPIVILMGFFSFSAVEVTRAQIGLSSGGTTEEAPKLDDPETTAGVREMVSQLSDDAVRALLIERLDAVAEQKESWTVGQPKVSLSRWYDTPGLHEMLPT